MRSVGRLLFLYHIDAVKNAIRERCADVMASRNAEIAIQRGADLAVRRGSTGVFCDLVIVGSLAGGTGSGCFLDCAYLARALSIEGLAAVEDIRGMLLLPDVFRQVSFPDVQLQTINANGYAALAELEYFNGRERRPFPIGAWGGATPLEQITEYPFQTTHLFSGDNGGGPRSADVMFDLVAESIVASTVGSLAPSLRGGRSNAMAGAYQGDYRLSVEARDESQGGATGTATESHSVYERVWPTRYSSAGVSSLTLMLPELHRLAAVRLLGRLLNWEIGAESPRAADLATSVDSAVNMLRGRQDLLGRLEQGVQTRARRVGEVSQVSEAQGEWESHVRSLRELAQDLGSPDETTLQVVITLVTDAKDLAATDAAAMCGGLPLDAGIVERELALSETIRHLEKHLKSLQAISPAAETIPAPPALAAWRKLARARSPDLFGLRKRSLKSIRTRLVEEILESTRPLLQYMSDRLRQLYLLDLIDELREEASRLRSDAQELESLRRGLTRLHHNLVRPFMDFGRRILTKHLAEKPELLDEEISRALERQQLTLSGPQDLAALHRSVLGEYLPDEDGPLTFARAMRAGHSTVADVLDSLVDICVRLLGKFPTERSILRMLDLADPATTLRHLEAASAEAGPCWPLGSNPEFRKTILSYQFACAAASAKGSETEGSIVKWLASNHWEWLPALDSRPGDTEGELLLVHEAHGYALPSLASLVQMRHAYDHEVGRGTRANRHIDVSLCSMLPVLKLPDPQEIYGEVDSWDQAFLAIQLGVIRWDESSGVYFFSPDSVRRIDLGSTYQSVAVWLRNDGREFRRQIERRNQEWFEDSLNFGSDASAQERLIRLVDLDLTLDLIGRHRFPRLSGGRPSPEHTMIRRLRQNQVSVCVQALIKSEAEHDLESQLPDLKRTRALALQRLVVFVGPRPTVLGHETIPGQRIPRPLFASADVGEEGSSALREAFDPAWFADSNLPKEILTLFPEYLEDGYEPPEDQAFAPSSRTSRKRADDLEGEVRRLVGKGAYADARAAFRAAVESDPSRSRRLNLELGFLPALADAESKGGDQGDSRVRHARWQAKLWRALCDRNDFELEEVSALSPGETEESPQTDESDRARSDLPVTVVQPSGSQEVGAVLEESVVKLFRQLFDFGKAEEHRLRSLRRQAGGMQFGHDVSFECSVAGKQSVRCHIECKNLTRDVSPRDISDKLLQSEMHWGENSIDHWILISPRSNPGNELDKFIQQWNEQKSDLFQVQAWTPETGVHEFFGLLPEAYNLFYEGSPEFGAHPDAWTDEERRETHARWLRKLEPVLRLPVGWRSYLRSPAKLCVAREQPGMMEGLYRDHVSLHCTDIADARLPGDLEDNVRQWLEDPDEEVLLLLGAFGDGKTVFTYLLARSLSEEFVKDPSHGTIPLRLALRDFRKFGSARNMLRNRLEDFGASLDGWHQLCAGEDRILIILDGFDEMSRRLRAKR